MPVNVPTNDEFTALTARVTALEQGSHPNPGPQPSPDGTSTTQVGVVVTDSHLRAFTLMAADASNKGQQIGINGTRDTRTANAVQLYAKGGVVSHKNQAGNWYACDTANPVNWSQVADPTGAAPPTSGMFQLANGSITDPSGKPWRANGINCLYRAVWGDGSVQIGRYTSANLKRGFPKINFIRFADLYATSLDNSSHPANDASVRNWVNDLTSNGIVVYAEVHYTGNYATGGALNDACSWLAEWASVFKGNPFVWLGSQNEPHGDGGGISNMMRTMYNAARGQGFHNPFLFACGNPGGETAGMNGANFADTDNTGFDPHYYGWMPSNGMSWDHVKSEAAAFQNKQGPMTVLCLETGDATDGNNRDGNWMDVLNQALNNPAGSAAWQANWTPIGGADNLLANQDFSALTDYGAVVRDAMH